MTFKYAKIKWPLHMDYHPYFIPRLGEKRKKKMAKE
jgi:hypothetical protein